jgi:hypothetical protein
MNSPCLNPQSHKPADVIKVIRHNKTHNFFADGDWTTDFHAAEKFSDTLSVLKRKQEYKLKNVDVVLVMGDRPSSYDIALPLG